MALVAIVAVVGFAPLGQAVTINGERQVIVAGPQYEAPPPPEPEVSPADFKKLKTEVANFKKSTNGQFARIDGELEAQKEVANDIESKVDGRIKDVEVKIDRHEGWLKNLTNAHNKTVISLESLRKNVGENIDKLFQIIYWVFGAIGLFVVIVAVMSRRR